MSLFTNSRAFRVSLVEKTETVSANDSTRSSPIQIYSHVLSLFTNVSLFTTLNNIVAFDWSIPQTVQRDWLKDNGSASPKMNGR